MEVVDNDESVVNAAESAHGLKLTRRGSGNSGHAGISVVLADAAAHVSDVETDSVNCILLDAYDAKGRVPTHLQAAPFLKDLGRCLAPGGTIIANLWNGTEAARKEAESFRKTLVGAAQGVACYGLRVVGHEKNRILIATKPAADEAAQPRLASQRRLLELAADAHATSGTEPAMLETMRSNAATLETW